MKTQIEINRTLRRKSERGTALIEYAVLVALITVTASVGVRELGQATDTVFQTAAMAALGGGTATNGDED